jgi:hypothetical protein
MAGERPRDEDEATKAERQLRLALAAEAKHEREQRETIKKGFFGCVGIAVILFILAMLFL